MAPGSFARALSPWVLLPGLVFIPGGCADTPEALAVPSQIVRQEPWTWDDSAGSTIVTKHYVIYTTISDQRVRESLALIMEGAFAQYRQLAPAAPLSDRPMECYVFASRREWAQFTHDRTGADASVYLHIARGGYTVRDWYAAYFIGEAGTYSVAAHEGFHQFAARNFKMRIPPFLEEGLACRFENVELDHGVPRWNLEANPNRLSSLQNGASAGKLMALSDLAVTHAGQVVNGPGARISAFYGESWAFAQFLLTQGDGKYRKGLEQMLADAASGHLAGIVARPTDAVFWNPASAKPLLERYLQMNLKTLDGEFQAYISRLLARHDALE